MQALHLRFLVPIAALAALQLGESATAQSVDRQRFQLLLPDERSGRANRHGFSVAVKSDGTMIAVSRPFRASVQPEFGEVWVYERSATGWLIVDAMEPPPGAFDNRMGMDIRWRGEQLLVGSQQIPIPPGPSEAGRVYVYEPRASNQPVQTIEPTNLAGIDLFGSFLTVDPDDEEAIWISAAGDDTLFPDNGAILRFERINGTWTETYRWVNDVPNRTFFGATMATDGDFFAAFAGAHRTIIFRVNGANELEEIQDLPEPPSVSGSAVGIDLAMGNGFLFIADPGIDFAPFGTRGRVLVYRYGPSGQFEPFQILVYPAEFNFVVSDGFGASVHFDEGLLYVGAQNGGPIGTTDFTGIAFAYRFDGTEWVLRDTFAPPRNQQTGKFGYDIDASGSTVAIGATESFNGWTDWDGQAFSIERTLGATICEADCGPLGAIGQPGRLRVFGHELLAQGNLVLQADFLSPSATGVLFFGGEGGPAAPASPAGAAGCLCVGSGLTRLQFAAISSGAAEVNAFDAVQFSTINVMAGSRTTFQAWYRDGSSGGGVTSRLTNAVEIKWL